MCIGGADRSGLERLLRYCARPPFALEHLQQLDAKHLVYHSPKPRLDGSSDLVLTPLELIDKIAALVPPPQAHRHRYYGVLAPNASLRVAVTALAPRRHPPTRRRSRATAPHRATCGRCCWRESTKPSRWPARSVTHRCGSSLSSTMSAPCEKFSTTSANRRSHRESPPRAGHRCGRPQELRSKRATTLNGIWRRSPHRSSSSISASFGDEQVFPRHGYACAFGSVRGRFSVRGGKFLALSRMCLSEFGFSGGTQR